MKAFTIQQQPNETVRHQAECMGISISEVRRMRAAEKGN